MHQPEGPKLDTIVTQTVYASVPKYLPPPL